MKIHIFTRESDYSFIFLKFINRNLDISDNLFVFRNKSGKYQYSEDVTGKLRYYDSPAKMLYYLLPEIIKADEIFFHYFPVGPSLYFWFLSLPILKRKKVNWKLWGGDLYFYRDENKSLKNRIFEKLRRKIIYNVDRIICPVRGDYDLACKIYNTKAKYYYAIYPIWIDFKQIEEVSNIQIKTSNEKIILLGNSASSTNNHLEVLNWLSLLKTENIRIICPLSYGSEEYAKQVIIRGKEIFHDKFVPVMNFMSQYEYAKLLLGVDIAIMNHRRQQGLGNLFTLLFLKKKVYIRSDISSFRYFQELGITVYDTLSISKLTFQELFDLNQVEGLENARSIRNEISNENLVDLWSGLI